MLEQTILPFERWRAPDVPFEGTLFVAPNTGPNQVAPDGGESVPPLRQTADGTGTVHSVTEGGIAASHDKISPLLVQVAPTISGHDLNSIRMPPVPLACWRADDMRFTFESSFVRPEIANDIGALKELIERHSQTDPQRKPSVTVFGHADPTGDDDFNKALSGRRAQAVYALLTRRVDLWEDLRSQPIGNDKWEPDAIRKMQSTLGQPPTGALSPAQRAALFREYMDHVCTPRDESGAAVFDDTGQTVTLELKPTDFLARGADSGGAGDFQGCGAFNPILMFSESENRDFAESESKEARDRENAPNRRVLVFLFRPGATVKPDRWPCPRAKEGTAKCKRRFWSDAALKRSFQEKRREYKDIQDTFACRFYDRLSHNSPCERGRTTVQIRLYDPKGIAIPGAPFDVQIGRRKPTPVTVADANGVAVVHDVEVPTQCVVRWGFPPSQKGAKPELIFILDMFLTHDNLSRNEEARQKLNNLGYPEENGLVTNVAAFQTDYGSLSTPPLPASNGILDERTMKLLREVYRQCATDLRHTPPKDTVTP